MWPRSRERCLISWLVFAGEKRELLWLWQGRQHAHGQLMQQVPRPVRGGEHSRPASFRLREPRQSQPTGGLLAQVFLLRALGRSSPRAARKCFSASFARLFFRSRSPLIQSCLAMTSHRVDSYSSGRRYYNGETDEATERLVADRHHQLAGSPHRAPPPGRAPAAPRTGRIVPR